MDKYTATELAFKNGYEKGYEAAKAEIVHCKDCRYLQSDSHGLWCFNDYENNLQPEDFCSHGEKKVYPNLTERTINALNKMGKAVHGGNDG